MATSNRMLVLAKRPSGMVDETTTRIEQGTVPSPGPGQAVVAVRYLSIDPTIRTWMDDREGYLPPIALGETVRSGGIGEVIESNDDSLKPGDLVFGMTGWQEVVLAGNGATAVQVIPPGIEPGAAINVFGVTGMTAYFGLIDVGKIKEGDAVVVSGAAGATGSTVGQIARIKGASKVVGIAGGPDKCKWVTDELGFDACVDYKNEDVDGALRKQLPDGIDLYFDNVGGEILDICLSQLAMRARIVMCGQISVYNATQRPKGPANLFNLIVKRAHMEGFLVLDYLDRFAEAQLAMAGWVMEGKVKHTEHIVEGLENAPSALNLLFTGGNIGKVMVKL